MKAKKMFEKIGYEYLDPLFSNSIMYKREDGEYSKMIAFFKDQHSFSISRIKCKEDGTEYTYYEVYEDELKAINKQLKELRWI